MALPSRHDVVAALASDALAQARKSGAMTVECWMPARHPYRELLAGLGFNQKRRTLGLYATGLRFDDSGLDFLDDPRATIHISLGDTDLV